MFFHNIRVTVCTFYLIMIIDHSDIILSDLATLASRQFCPGETNLSRRAQSTETPARRITGYMFLLVSGRAFGRASD